jgi:signal transduction histidine kinase
MQPDVMSSVSNVIELPVRHAEHERHVLQHDVVLALATADDLASAMVQVVESVHRSSGATRVEWWATGDDGALQLGAAIGIARGGRHDLPLGRAGAFVLHGRSVEPEIASALMTAAPIIRRRAAEERLARTAIDLARRNDALEDFAALVAHELKTPLQAALLADDPSRYVEDALDLVDALLEAARSETSERIFVSAETCLDQAVEDVGAEIEVTTDLRATLPLPPGPLRVLLRNLLSNAVAAGAHHVHVAAVRSSRSWRLSVDDDGVGLAEVDRYAAGSGLGLSLSRRIAGRFGGILELAPRPSGGTRAMLEFPEAA